MPETPFDIFEEPVAAPPDTSLFPGDFACSDEDREAFKAAAELAHKTLNEALAKSVKSITEEINSEVYEYLFMRMETDTAYNFEQMVRDRCRQIFNGLINGGYQEATAKHWLWEFDYREFRESMYKANHEAFENQIISDRDKQIAELNLEVNLWRTKYWDKVNSNA